MATYARAGWQWYKTMLQDRPLLTKAVTSSILMSVSDLACQQYETEVARRLVERGPDVNLQRGCPRFKDCPPELGNPPQLFRQDWKRTFHVGVTGLTLTGPLGHCWYNLLEAIVRVRHRFLGLVIRMILDAFVYSPVAVAGYFTWRVVLDGGGLDCIRKHLSIKWAGALLASWSFWPAANIVNFSLVPLQFRVLYNNSLSLLWNGYLSHLNAIKMEEVVDEQLTTKQRQEQERQSMKGNSMDEAVHQINRGGATIDEQDTKACAKDRLPGPVVCNCAHCRGVRG